MKPLAKLLLVAASLLPAAAARGQCIAQWQSAGPMPGTNQPTRALVTWDPDGAGPATPRLVLGGEFTVAGNALASRIAT